MLAVHQVTALDLADIINGVAFRFSVADRRKNIFVAVNTVSAVVVR